MKKKNSSIFTFVFYLLLIAIIIFAIASLFADNKEEEVFTYGDLVAVFENNQVHSYIFDEDSYTILIKLYTGQLETNDKGETYEVYKEQEYVFSSHDYY